jgi:hypothetical protein
MINDIPELQGMPTSLARKKLWRYYAKSFQDWRSWMGTILFLLSYVLFFWLMFVLVDGIDFFPLRLTVLILSLYAYLHYVGNFYFIFILKLVAGLMKSDQTNNGQT